MTNEETWDAMIDAYSIRDFVPTSIEPVRTHFFSTFDHFLTLPASEYGGEWLAEVTARAAHQNEQYLEVMHLPATLAILSAAQELHWQSDKPDALNQLITDASPMLPELQRAAQVELTQIENKRNGLQRCGTVGAAPGCNVKVRWIFSVLRDHVPAEVFLQSLVGFSLASTDSRVVGVNVLREEDLKSSLEQYHLGMEIIHVLKDKYPAVHVSLHAGELAEGIVEPNDLDFHVRDAVEIAGAERIGHGVDIAHEVNSRELLAEMASRHILVEINLTSNDLILGVRGRDHPLRSYMSAGVPVALSTDDEGVSRIDLTHEFVKAAMEQSLNYSELKRMVRNSLEYSFLPGKSLWKTKMLTEFQPPCKSIDLKAIRSSCRSFLKANERAEEEFDLEKRFLTFEAVHQATHK
jgi:adenosine deaminase